MKRSRLLIFTMAMFLTTQVISVFPNNPIILDVLAAEPAIIEANIMQPPQNVNVSYDATKFIIEWQNPKSIEEFAKTCYDNYNGTVVYIVDWRINGGEWHHDKEITQDESVFSFFDDYHASLSGSPVYDIENGNSFFNTKAEINKLFIGLPYSGSVSEWLKTNNVEFRLRYICDYWDEINNSQNNLHSPFSNNAMVGTANPTGLGAQTPMDEFGVPVAPTIAEAPEELSAVYMTLNLRWKVPESILAVSDAGTASAIAYIDWKINNGPWHNTLEESKTDFSAMAFQYISLSEHDLDSDGYVSLSIPRNALGIDEPLLTWLSYNTCYFKVRYVLITGIEEDLISPYSNTVMVGKGTVAPSAPKLEKPIQLSAQLTSKWEKHIIDFSWAIPQSILAINKTMPIATFVDYKPQGGKWQSEEMGLSKVIWKVGNLVDSYDVWFDQAEVKGVYTFRLCFGTEYSPGKWTFSGYSDLITVDFGTGKVTNPNNTVAKDAYKGASSWAVAELDKAVTYGFITNRIKDNMQAPITHEEFAEIVVKLYEKYTNTTTVYTPPAPFSDTDNADIYKANQLGIVLGTNTAKKLFSPQINITREQMAAMLYRAIVKMAPSADLSTEGAEVFSDIGSIYPSFIESVKFLNKNGIMKTYNGRICPVDTASREQAVLMVVRIFENFK